MYKNKLQDEIVNHLKLYLETFSSNKVFLIKYLTSLLFSTVSLNSTIKKKQNKQKILIITISSFVSKTNTYCFSEAQNILKYRGNIFLYLKILLSKMANDLSNVTVVMDILLWAMNGVTMNCNMAITMRSLRPNSDSAVTASRHHELPTAVKAQTLNCIFVTNKRLYHSSSNFIHF